MSGVQVSVKFGGKLAKLRAIVSGQSSQMEAAMQRMLQLYGQLSIKRFDLMAAGESGPDPKDSSPHGPWDPLSENTIGSLSKVRRLLLILVRTGLMRDMIRQGFSSSSSMVKSGEARFEMSATYAPLQYPDSDVDTLQVLGYHQEGTDRMPQRKVIARLEPRAMQLIANEGKKVILSGL